MNINWDRFLAYNLPVIMRRPRIFALLKCLIGVLVSIHAQAIKWRTEALQRSNYDTSAIMLERIVFEQMGLRIRIEPSEAQPGSFDVYVDSEGVEYEVARLRAILDKYKAAEKQYRIINSNQVFQTLFDGYVCEMEPVFRSCQFAGYVCEPIRTNSIFLYAEYRSLDSRFIYIQSDYAVTSPVSVSVAGSEYTLIISKGEKKSQTGVAFIDPNGGPVESQIYMTGLGLSADDYFDYVYNTDAILL